jgi:hypothetical protein
MLEAESQHLFADLASVRHNYILSHKTLSISVGCFQRTKNSSSEKQDKTDGSLTL